MRNISVSDIILRAREEVNMEDPSFINQDEALRYAQSSYDELWGKVAVAYGEDYLTKVIDFPLVAGTDTYDLPDDFFKVRKIGIKISGITEFSTVHKVSLQELFRYQTTSGNINLGYNSYLHYCLLGIDQADGNKGQIIFAPDNQGETLRMYYTPLAPKLAIVETEGAVTEVPEWNGWSEYVVVDMAIKMADKDEKDTSVLMQRKTALNARITKTSLVRDANEPSKMIRRRTRSGGATRLFNPKGD